MKIGIIGTGAIGSTIANKMIDAGHQVKVSNRDSFEELEKKANEIGALPASLMDVVKDVDGNLYKLMFLALTNDSGERGYPVFKYEILNVFDNRLEAINDEMRLHEMYGVGSNPMFYNKQKQGSHVIDFTGKNHTEDSKIKIGVASKERGISDKARENLQWHGKNRKRTEEEKKKIMTRFSNFQINHFQISQHGH